MAVPATKSKQRDKREFEILLLMCYNTRKGAMEMKLKFNVTGMTCAACSARVEKVTGQVDGVDKAEVNLMGGTMMVEATGEDVQARIIQAVTAAGYGASLAGEKKKEETAGDGGMKDMKKRN